MEKIVYKVVEKRTRHGSNFTLMKSCCENNDQLEILRRWRKQYRKWFPTYRKNKIIRAPENSLGIMTFETKQYAAKFLEDEFSDYDLTMKIIKVEGINKMPTPDSIIENAGTVYVWITAGEVETEAYNFMDASVTYEVIRNERPIPEGLACFKAVKVLE